MSEFSSEEEQRRKQAIFDTMSPKYQKRILKKSYDKWNPFEAPKDPIDIRKDATRRTSQQLIREFLQSRETEEYSNSYGKGVVDICVGIINDDDRYKAMYEFSCWYQALLEKTAEQNKNKS
jgi:hypothetical protein